MNGADHQGAGLRAAVRAAIAADDLEDTVRAVLERRFPAEGQGTSLDEVGAALGMSPAMVAHIEFAALCAIAAGRSQPGAAIQTRSGPGGWPGRLHSRGGRA
jgi:DNA-directed RNA polymerase sigma subunit (sigma70/sigma32)